MIAQLFLPFHLHSLLYFIDKSRIIGEVACCMPSYGYIHDHFTCMIAIIKHPNGIVLIAETEIGDFSPKGILFT